MEAVVGIFIGLAILAGLYFLVFKKKKDQPKEVKGFKEYNLKVANLTAKGMEENRDFVVGIIGLPEFKSKTPEQIEAWIKEKVGKEGTLSNYDAVLGLQELTYTTADKTIDVFFLIVEKTSQNVIDWKEPKPETEDERLFRKYGFVPYRHTGLNILFQTEDSKVFKIIAPDTNEDLTDFVQAELDKFPNGTLLAPTVIEFEGEFWTEGNPEKSKELECALHILDKEFFIIRGGTFFTKAPASPYGGNVGNNDYSRRRHFRFENCKGFTFENTTITGSNIIDGELIGTTPELTPEFWKGGKDTGNIKIGFAAYKMYWEFEHAADFLNCQNFTVEGLTIKGVWGDGICLGYGNDNFIIRRNKISWCGRQVMALYNCSNGLIEYNEDSHCRRGGYDFEPNGHTGYVDGIEVRYNKLNPMMTVFPALGKGRVDNIHIHHNEYTTGGGTIHLKDSSLRTTRKNIAFRFNRRMNSFGSPASPIRFNLVDNILIEGNFEHLSARQSQSFATFEDCNNVRLINNEIEDGTNIKVRNSEVTIEGGTPLEIIEI